MSSLHGILLEEESGGSYIKRRGQTRKGTWGRCYGREREVKEVGRMKK
jgi:hypothetical protein